MTPRLAHAQQVPRPTQAACVIRVGSKAVFIQDPWSRRYALPGGVVQPGASLEAAAVQQTQATTGLVVTAGPRLGTLGDCAVFDCRLTTPVALLPRDVLLVPVEARYSTTQARLMSADALKPEQWRYASQAAATIALCAAAAPHEARWARHVAPPTSALFEAELVVTRFVQAHVPIAYRACIEAWSLFGTDFALYVVAILVWCRLGYRHGLELMLYMMGVSLFNCLLKQSFQLPRPFHLDPLLQLQYQSSFGFPSGHTTCVTSLALWTVTRAAPGRRGLHYGLLLCVLACSFSRVYLGVHFVHDVLGAWAESLLACALYVSWLKRAGHTFVSLRAWTMILAALGSWTLWRTPEPEPVVFMCMGAGLLLGALGCRGPSLPWSWPAGGALAATMAMGFVGARAAFAALKPAEASLQLCLALVVFSGFLRGVLMPLCHVLFVAGGQLRQGRAGVAGSDAHSGNRR